MKIRAFREKEDSLNDWHERIVILWEEDDAKPPDREMADGAFKRIFGRAPDKKVIRAHDGGDWYATLLPRGRVIGYSFQGGFVGILASTPCDSKAVSEGQDVGPIVDAER